MTKKQLSHMDDAPLLERRQTVLTTIARLSRIKMYDRHKTDRRTLAMLMSAEAEKQDIDAVLAERGVTV